MPQTRKTEAIWIDAQSRWQIKVQVSGKRKAFYSFTPGRKGKIEAERKADAWLDDGASEDPRLETAWADFLVELSKTTGTLNYQKHESVGRIWVLTPTLKLKRISAITIQDWQNVLNAMSEAGLAKKTISGARGCITAFYRYCRKCRLPLERPEYLTIPTSAPVGQRSILQPDKLKTLFQVNWIEKYGKRSTCFYILAWRFIVLSGLRRGELCGLKTEDLQGNVLYIHRSINRVNEETTGKNDNARRYMVLSSRLLSLLEDQKKMLKEHHVISPYIFPDACGARTNPNNLYKAWSTYRKQHDMGCSIHEMRHTMISIVQHDVPDTLLKSVVGHSKAMDTKGIYGHAVDGDALRASQLIDDVFGRILDK